jgi:phosphate transport system protein
MFHFGFFSFTIEWHHSIEGCEKEDGTMRQLTIGIGELRDCIARMSGLVESAVENSVEALLRGNPAVAVQVLDGEKAINLLEMEIDSRAIRLLALHQPVACDLRFITAVMKINTDLERMGDLAVNISRRTIDSALSNATQHSCGEVIRERITDMVTVVKSMVSGSIEAFLERRGTLAEEILRRDDEVDRLLRSITQQLVVAIHEMPLAAEGALEWMLAARNLERIADHATNVAEAALFLLSGIDVRHQAGAFPPEMRQIDSHAA